MTIYLGTQGWSYKSWDGVFYLQGTPPGDYLAEYAKKLRAVEIVTARLVILSGLKPE